MYQRLYYYIYKIQEGIWRLLSRKTTVNGLCLVFHHITDTHLDELDNCQCRISEFEEILADLRNRGYLFVGIKEGMRLIEDRSSLKFAIVTFDDVPDDFVSNAFPILQKMNIPFTLFVTTGFLGKQGFLDKDQIVCLSKNLLCTIGAHTQNHPQLRYCNDIRSEIVECRSELEAIIGKQVEYFAYPYGRINTVNRTARKIASDHYEYAFSTIDCKISDFTSRHKFNMPRIPLNKLYSE
jgi:peptidoglycan/xylan/chitin deacetylase (PgdA/CDA1 family)